jgi:hypothetical protein
LKDAKPDILAEIKAKLKQVMKADDDTPNKIAQNADLTALETFGGEEITDILGTTAGDSGSQFLVEVGVPESSEFFGQVNTRAVVYAKDRAAALITELDDATRNDIRDTIAAGLEDGLSFGQLSDKLSEMYSFSEDRAELIARTEIASAANHGVLAGMQELKDQGAKIKKAWNPDAQACDACLELGDLGFIDLDAEFETEDGDTADAPPLHPRCRCNLISEIEDE